MKCFNINTYKEQITQDHPYLYRGEEVQIITVFKDIQVALIEDKKGKIFEIPLESLEQT